jgi:transcriptional regulator with XRE-family HTH domain
MQNVFGENLRRIREERELSQEQLGEILGTSKQVISRYEKNQRTPKWDVVSSYAKRLNIPMADLTGHNDSNTSGDTATEVDEDTMLLSRASKRLSPEQQKRAMNILKASFDDVDWGDE